MRHQEDGWSRWVSSNELIFGQLCGFLIPGGHILFGCLFVGVCYNNMMITNTFCDAILKF